MLLNGFLVRFQNPDHAPVELLNGHNATISGTYKYALGKRESDILNLTDSMLST